MGPAHKASGMTTVTTTSCVEWQTPLGNVKVDFETIREIIRISFASEGKVRISAVNKHIEESEYSLEMQLPFIKKIFGDAGLANELKIVPFVVGDLKYADRYRDLAEVLLPLYMNERTLFIVSTDFCHWGKHFKYHPI